MISELVDSGLLTCPVCRGPLPEGGLRNAPLQWEAVHVERAGRPLHGMLSCGSCASRFPLIDGVAVIFADTAGYLRSQEGELHARRDLPAEVADYVAQAWAEDGTAAWHRQMRAVYSRSLLEADGLADEMLSPLIERSKAALQARRRALSTRLGAGATVLDAGCGVGENALCLAGLGLRVVAFDRDFAALRQLSAMVGEGAVEVPFWDHGGADFSTRRAQASGAELAASVAVVAGDALDPPFAAAAFDGVMALNLIDNVAEPVTCVRQLNGVLRAGGRLVLMSPFDWSGRATPRSARLGDGVRLAGAGSDPVEPLHALVSGRLPRHAPELSLVVVHSDELPWVLVRHNRSAHLFVSHLVEADKSPA